jgi:hypothetical protein
MNIAYFKKCIPAFLIVIIVLCQSEAYSQNPFYATAYGNPNAEHWMLTGFDDSISGNWSYVEPLQQPLFGVNAYYWSVNNKVFICGGATQDVVPQASCWWYNIALNTYEPAASLPHGRYSGKLVRVRDSLYLIGSVDSTFNSADGLIFKYSLNQNTWVQKTSMPAPYVHECAAAVINDSLIVTIGGSTNAFLNAVNYVRVYNPWRDTWTSSSSLYPVNNTSSHAENLKIDTVNHIIVLGGYGNGPLNSVYNGTVTLRNSDSVTISWAQFDTLNAFLFGQAVYRVAGAKWQNGLNDYALFGPAMNGANAVNRIWGIKFYNANDFVWARFDPKTIDTAGNISTYGVKSGADTNFLFLFGGFRNPNVVSSAQKYTFATPPPPIGIINNNGGIPRDYMLGQNYPNPFNPVTNFKFQIPNYAFVKLIIYDMLGRELAALVDGNLNPGFYTAEWDASNMPSGVYFFRLTVFEALGGFDASFTQTRKMVLIK